MKEKCCYLLVTNRPLKCCSISHWSQGRDKPQKALSEMATKSFPGLLEGSCSMSHSICSCKPLFHTITRQTFSKTLNKVIVHNCSLGAVTALWVQSAFTSPSLNPGISRCIYYILISACAHFWVCWASPAENIWLLEKLLISGTQTSPSKQIPTGQSSLINEKLWISILKLGMEVTSYEQMNEN